MSLVPASAGQGFFVPAAAKWLCRKNKFSRLSMFTRLPQLRGMGGDSPCLGIARRASPAGDWIRANKLQQ
jgi:hypothetical protein